MDAHLPRDFEGEDNPARRRPGNVGHARILKVRGDVPAKSHDGIGTLQHAELLEIHIAVPARSQQEMPAQNRAS